MYYIYGRVWAIPSRYEMYKDMKLQLQVSIKKLVGVHQNHVGVYRVVIHDNINP